MKSLMKIALFVAFMPGGILNVLLMADPPGPPPPPGGGHGTGGNQPPGAPIDGGMGILVILGTSLGCVRVFRKGADPPGKVDL
jgi:hypothetical protein